MMSEKCVNNHREAHEARASIPNSGMTSSEVSRALTSQWTLAQPTNVISKLFLFTLWIICTLTSLIFRRANFESFHLHFKSHDSRHTSEELQLPQELFDYFLHSRIFCLHENNFSSTLPRRRHSKWIFKVSILLLNWYEASRFSSRSSHFHFGLALSIIIINKTTNRRKYLFALLHEGECL